MGSLECSNEKREAEGSRTDNVKVWARGQDTGHGVQERANGKAQACDPVRGCEHPLVQRLKKNDKWKNEQYSRSWCVSATGVQGGEAEGGRWKDEEKQMERGAGGGSKE